MRRKRKIRGFTPQQNAQTVELVRTSGKSVAEIVVHEDGALAITSPVGEPTFRIDVAAEHFATLDINEDGSADLIASTADGQVLWFSLPDGYQTVVGDPNEEIPGTFRRVWRDAGPTDCTSFAWTAWYG